MAEKRPSANNSYRPKAVIRGNSSSQPSWDLCKYALKDQFAGDTRVIISWAVRCKS